MSAFEADAWLTIGEWRACQDRLRDALGSDPGPFADVHARLAAAQLAAWQGRTAEAQAHLTRADELFAEGSEFLPFSFDVSRAVVSLAADDPEAALAAALGRDRLVRRSTGQMRMADAVGRTGAGRSDRGRPRRRA